MHSQSRYAIYFVPADASALWRFGCRVIGYDAAATGMEAPPPFPIPAAATAAGAFIEPARYGFNATLKALLELAPCTDGASLLAAGDAFATSVRPFSLGRLAVAKLDRFIALVPATPPAEFSVLAGRSLREFDRFRAPLSAAEIAHLDRWGYPSVFERFQFHMMLSGLLAPEHSEPLLSGLTALHAPIDTDAILDGIAVFKQPSRCIRFQMLEHFVFGG